MMIARIFWFLAILFLYAPIVEIGDYFLTVGGAAALLIVVLRFPFQQAPALVAIAIAAVYPLLVFGLHTSVGSTWALQFNEFFGSYILWCVSAALIVAGFFCSSPKVQFSEHVILIPLTVLGVFQFAMALLFGSTLGFDLVAPLISFDIYDSYLNIFATDYARAIGTYYEPSIFGRVVATLAAMLLIRTEKALLPMAYIAVNTVTTQSFGLLVLGFLIFGIWYARLSARLIPAAFVGALALVVSYNLIALRVEEGVTQRGSTYVRLIAPLRALYEVLADYPVGLPLGSNEVVVRYLLTPQGFAESKITSGVYELVLYAGLPAIILLVIGLWALLKTTAAGYKPRAIAVMMLLFGTVASSSFLSIESSLLLYMLIVRARESERITAIARQVPQQATALSAAPEFAGVQATVKD